VCLSSLPSFRAHLIVSSSLNSGGAIAGSVSQHIGRRLTIILFVLLSGVFIPLWILPSGFNALAAGAFCVQFGVQGAWGVIPIQLAEMSPPGFRATFPGVAYQIGNVRYFVSLFPERLTIFSGW
jgi:SHS family lactate transporter-like MFS transporter